MTTLADRYVWAVIRLLPESQRHDTEAALEEFIAESLAVRVDAEPDRDPAEIEREVISDLGDPSVMASRYSERPRALIGPEVFPEYLWVLRLVIAVAVPAVTAFAMFGAGLQDDARFRDVISAGSGAVFNGLIQVAFWVTLVYAFADRWKSHDPWTPDRLPEVLVRRSASVGMGDTIVGIIMTVLAGVALIWQHRWPPLEDSAGVGVPFFDPGMWRGAGQGLLVLLLASVAVQAFVLARRHWNGGLAIANAAINMASLGIVVGLASQDHLVNAEFLAIVADRTEVEVSPQNAAWLVVAVIAAIEIWDTIEAFIAARRARG